MRKREEIERAAFSLLSEFSAIDSDGPVNLQKILVGIGADVRHGAWGNEQSRINADGVLVVFLPQHETAKQYRFLVAHALGHYCLHFYGSEVTFMRGSGRDVVEANQFASALMMPESLFRSVWAELDGDAHKVAELMWVSTAAVHVRALVLRLEKDERAVLG